MGAVSGREAFFDAGLHVLAEHGYGGLKLAKVCEYLGVTTGSFYHHFANWSAYTGQLVGYWQDGTTDRVVRAVRAEPDPRRRIDRLIEAGLTLPHGAEAAIRVWSAIDPAVHRVQSSVDRQRFEVVYESALAILRNDRQAEVFARWAVYLLVGYEQATLPPDASGIRWIADQLLDALDSGRFASAASHE